MLIIVSQTANTNNLTGRNQNGNTVMSAKEAIPFTVKGPIPVQLPDTIANADLVKKTGCAIVDLNFQYPSQIGELVLCNYYTAWMSVYVKRMINNGSTFQSAEKDCGFQSGSRVVRPHLERSYSVDVSNHGKRTGGFYMNTSTNNGMIRPEDSDFLLGSSVTSGGSNNKRRHSSEPFLPEVVDRPWECSIQMKVLMECPHFESGSQDIFSIPATEMKTRWATNDNIVKGKACQDSGQYGRSIVEWRDVVVMRLVIHQPSTVWKRFSIEDVNVFRHLPKRGFSHYDDLLRQRDNWFSVLRKNTKAMLSGQLVEPENRDSDDGAE